MGLFHPVMGPFYPHEPPPPFGGGVRGGLRRLCVKPIDYRQLCGDVIVMLS